MNLLNAIQMKCVDLNVKVLKYFEQNKLFLLSEKEQFLTLMYITHFPVIQFSQLISFCFVCPLLPR